MEKQIEEMRDTLANINGTNGIHILGYYPLAEELVKQGYRKVQQGEWEIVIGSNGKEKMVCTNCRHQQDLASTFTYCPNCGAKMKGAE